MTISAGTRFGWYEVVAQIGAGGMGEVYQAHDTKLGRDVAIKTLPEAFAHDAERLARFQREAKMLAALNHPNIAAIYGLEDGAGRNYLVMELIPGETLAERIKREGPVPVEEALRVQIAEALEAAHEKGIIHRDLKPGDGGEGRFGLRDAGEADVVYIRAQVGAARGETRYRRERYHAPSLPGANPGGRDSCAGAGGIGATRS